MFTKIIYNNFNFHNLFYDKRRFFFIFLRPGDTRMSGPPYEPGFSRRLSLAAPGAPGFFEAILEPMADDSFFVCKLNWLDICCGTFLFFDPCGEVTPAIFLKTAILSRIWLLTRPNMSIFSS
jgi:hypothetical protein